MNTIELYRDGNTLCAIERADTTSSASIYSILTCLDLDPTAVRWPHAFEFEGEFEGEGEGDSEQSA